MARAQTTRTAFGECLKRLIKDAEMSQLEFYSAAGITKPYFYDMVSGRMTPPPRDTLDRMVMVLERKKPLDKKARIELYDCAAVGRKEIPTDIRGIILSHPEYWGSIRKMISKMVKTDSAQGD